MTGESEYQHLIPNDSQDEVEAETPQAENQEVGGGTEDEVSYRTLLPKRDSKSW